MNLNVKRCLGETSVLHHQFRHPDETVGDGAGAAEGVAQRDAPEARRQDAVKGAGRAAALEMPQYHHAGLKAAALLDLPGGQPLLGLQLQNAVESGVN